MATAKTDNPTKTGATRRSKSAKPAAPVKAKAGGVESPLSVPAPVSIPSPAKTAPRHKASKATETRSKSARKASVMLKFVSDPTRLQVILFLADAEHHVGALCEQLGQSQPAVSHHLALLRHGGIIVPRRQGKNNFYSLSSTGAELAKILKILMVSATV